MTFEPKNKYPIKYWFIWKAVVKSQLVCMKWVIDAIKCLNWYVYDNLMEDLLILIVFNIKFKRKEIIKKHPFQFYWWHLHSLKQIKTNKNINWSYKFVYSAISQPYRSSYSPSY